MMVLLYMNTQRHFRDLETDSERGGAFEGFDRIVQPKHLAEFTFNDTLLGKYTASPRDLSGPVRIGLNRTLACNVYCMFAVTGPVDGEFVDKRDYGLGGSFVLVLNPSEFISLMFAAANSAGFNSQCGLVRYYDSQQDTCDIGPFHKRKEFSHQKEFRIIVRPSPGKVAELEAGSLVDITSEVLPASQVNELLDFSTKSAEEAGLLPPDY